MADRQLKASFLGQPRSPKVPAWESSRLPKYLPFAPVLTGDSPPSSHLWGGWGPASISPVSHPRHLVTLSTPTFVPSLFPDSAPAPTHLPSLLPHSPFKMPSRLYMEELSSVLYLSLFLLLLQWWLNEICLYCLWLVPGFVSLSPPPVFMFE